MSPGHSMWGPSQPSIRETLGRGTLLLPRGNSGSPVGGTRCGSRPVEGAGPSPAVTRTPEAAALEVFLLGGWAALMEGPHAASCPPAHSPGLTSVPLWAGLPLPMDPLAQALVRETGRHWATGAVEPWPGGSQNGAPGVGVSGLSDRSEWVQPGWGRSLGEAVAGV